MLMVGSSGAGICGWVFVEETGVAQIMRMRRIRRFIEGTHLVLKRGFSSCVKYQVDQVGT